MQIVARREGDELVLDGKMPWVTNLRREGFHVAAAVDQADGGPALVVALSHDDEGLSRSDDLQLMGMCSSDTAAVTITGVRIGRDRILSDNAGQWLPKVRPAFAGLQCGMSIGLARRALAEAGKVAGAGRSVLGEPIAQLSQQLARAEARMYAGLRSREFEANAAPLFELRIGLPRSSQAVSLELQASGARRTSPAPAAVARRWRGRNLRAGHHAELVRLKAAFCEGEGRRRYVPQTRPSARNIGLL